VLERMQDKTNRRRGTATPATPICLRVKGNTLATKKSKKRKRRSGSARGELKAMKSKVEERCGMREEKGKKSC